MLTICIDEVGWFHDQYYNPYNKGCGLLDPAMLEEDVWLAQLAIADYAALLREPVTLAPARRAERIILNAIERRCGLRPFA
jgi:hypothetical protein